MPGKRTKNVTNPQANSAWMKRKKELRDGNNAEIVRQGDWRVSCLQQREKEKRLTEKNRAEMTRLGL